jgi:hypothetical protein
MCICPRRVVLFVSYSINFFLLILQAYSVTTDNTTTTTDSTTNSNVAVLFIGEVLGRIWRVELDFTSATGRRIGLSG